MPAPGALTQCAVEERLELELGMRGLTTYAETVSVYGTEQVFVDGDDTPWSKAFLASCYASRGLKMRFTSGSGAECLMGATEGCSMLYLEARCLAVTRAAGSQGTQNGGIDGVNVAGSVPDGMREVIAENLLAMMHDLESCTGNDTLMSSSDIRRTAHTLPLLLAGSDFLFSGFGSIPAYDNAFGPSNFNAEDIDDYLVVQRDWGFEGVLRPQSDDDLLPLRRRAVEALRAVLDELDLARFSDADAEAVVQAHGSLDVPALDPHLVPDAADQLMQRGLTALDVVRALAVRGFEVEAERVLDMLRQRLYGDYLQTSAIFTEDMRVLSALSDPNDYAGPGTGYRMTAARRVETGAVRQVWAPATLVAEQDAHAGCLQLRELGPAQRGTRPDEVVVGLSPAFAHTIWLSLSGLTVAEVLRQVLAGIEEEGASARLVQVRRTLDVGAIGSTASRLAGSGIGIGLQAKGTALIHRADLPPLGNLELFSIAPRVTRELYRGLGRNAARYARSAEPEPLFLAESSEPLGPNYHARVVALVALERGSVARRRPGGGGSGMAELKPVYPLAESDTGQARTSSGRKVGEITLDAVVRGEIGPGDIRISPEVLRQQADFAEQGGNPQLADNLRRGAELVAFSDEELLDLYESLRPGRSSALELEQLAERLEARRGRSVRRARARGARRLRAPRARLLGDAGRRRRRRQLHHGARRRATHARRRARLPRRLARRDHRGEGLDRLRGGRERARGTRRAAARRARAPSAAGRAGSGRHRPRRARAPGGARPRAQRRRAPGQRDAVGRGRGRRAPAPAGRAGRRARPGGRARDRARRGFRGRRSGACARRASAAIASPA